MLRTHFSFPWDTTYRGALRYSQLWKLFIKLLDCLGLKWFGLRFYLANYTFTFYKCNVLVFCLSLKGVIGKILLDFCVRACTSWFAMGDNKDVDKDTISIVKDSPWDTTW